VKVVRHAPRAFLAKAQGFLERDEAENNLLFGLALSMAEGTMTVSATPILATVEDGDEVVLAALRTPPHNLVVSAGPTAALEALAADLRARGFALPGVIGPSSHAATFARIWAPQGHERAMSQMIMTATTVAPHTPAAGSFRHAEEADRDVLEVWAADFTGDRDSGRGWVARQLDERRLFVWESDGKPVSMAGVGGPTPNAIRVSGVYTPPDLRSRGYAHACVAALTARMLAEGRRFCLLYTDLANATANALYRRVGYQPVSESAMWRFAQPGP
jgi:predicted GNAT family acetyltransferase